MCNHNHIMIIIYSDLDHIYGVMGAWISGPIVEKEMYICGCGSSCSSIVNTLTLDKLSQYIIYNIDNISLIMLQ